MRISTTYEGQRCVNILARETQGVTLMSTESYTFPESIEHPAESIRRDQCALSTRWSMQQGGHTYRGHWHGSLAVCEDGSVFRAGYGWLDFSESKRIVATLCR